MRDLDLNKLVIGVREVFPDARVLWLANHQSTRYDQPMIEVSVRDCAVRVPVHEYSAEDAVQLLSRHLLHQGYSRV